MPEPEHTIPFADVAEETAPIVPPLDVRLQWAFAEGGVHGLTWKERCVLDYIVWRAGGKSGVCFASRDRMAADLRLTDKHGYIDTNALKRPLRALVVKGLVDAWAVHHLGEYQYRPRCTSSVDSILHDCQNVTHGVSFRHQQSVEMTLASYNKTPNSLSERDIMNSLEAEEREQFVKAIKDKLQEFDDQHDWRIEAAAVKTYLADPNQFETDVAVWQRKRDRRRARRY